MPDPRTVELLARHFTDPYRESVFTPLTDDEMATCIEALKACGVRHAPDRLHAGWARHLGTFLPAAIADDSGLLVVPADTARTGWGEAPSAGIYSVAVGTEPLPLGRYIVAPDPRTEATDE